MTPSLLRWTSGASAFVWGRIGIRASVTLDFGEARLLAESILDGLQTLLEVVLEVAAERGVPVGIWRIAQADHGIELQALERRERDLMLMSHPEMWPIRDRLFVKRIEDGCLDVGFLRPDRGPSMWAGHLVLQSPAGLHKSITGELGPLERALWPFDGYSSGKCLKNRWQLER